MSEIVSLHSIRHQYGERIALDGVSFSVQHGECFGLLGPNGSGKSTLLKILTTLLEPTGGEALICGADTVHEQAKVRSQIGVVFQSPSLDIHLTVRENLKYAGKLYGVAGEALEARLEASMTALGVLDRANDRVKQLSGGLKRRVELAKCLLHQPALLLLDEPSTGLDPVARREMWQYLKRLQEQQGLTVLVSTHYMDEAERCDRVAILDRGSVVVQGTPSQLKDRIGGECITIECKDPLGLRTRIADELGIEPMIMDDAVRIETDHAEMIVGELMTKFGKLIRSITIGKPTLADVFVHETGHMFEDRADATGNVLKR